MVWHVPAFFYLPTYRNLDPAIVPFFFVGVLLESVLFTWIYNGTGGSIFAVSMWHAFWDLVSASKGSEGMPAAVMTTVIALWSIAIVVIARPDTERASQTGPDTCMTAYKLYDYKAAGSSSARSRACERSESHIHSQMRGRFASFVR